MATHQEQIEVELALTPRAKNRTDYKILDAV